MPPLDASAAGRELADDLAAVSRRVVIRDGMHAAAVAVPLGAVLYLALLRAGVSIVGAISVASAFSLVSMAGWLASRRLRWSAAAAAKAIEQSCADSRNVVVTAEELSRHPDRASAWMTERVLVQARTITAAARGPAVVPLGRPSMAAVCGVAGALILASGLWHRASNTITHALQPPSGSSTLRPSGALALTATVTPPAYTGQPPKTIENPERIDALQGSRLHLTIQQPASWRVRFGNKPLNGVSNRAEANGIDLALDESGYLAIEPVNQDAAAVGRLLPVTVSPDRAPTIHVDAPGKDMLLPDAKRTVGLTASATDDFGLQSLELRFTKVSGSGEQFEFKEGSLPLAIARPSARAWTARGDIGIAALGLSPGDSLIYRVVGRDQRPGDAGFASSDTFFIEVAGPGQVALEGFEMPPDKERYALSQQMIVLKLERLKARERSLDRATLEQEVGNIAAEQRAVRANFIFLMGGHVEDEEEEAAHSDEITEGRLENTARREIMTAIQEMGRAEQGMAMVSTGAALPPARAAVEALQRAFGKNRYLLRTLPVRSRIDPSRRLTGERAGAADWQRDLAAPLADGPAAAARDLFRRLLDLSPSILGGSASPGALTALGEEALAVDPASTEWQGISRALLTLRDVAAQDSAKRRAALSDVLARTSAVAQRHAIAPTLIDRENQALRSAWAEERRR